MASLNPRRVRDSGRNRHLRTHALSHETDEALALFPPPRAQALYSTSQMFQSSPGTRISQQQLSSPQAVYSTLPGDLSNLSLRSPGGMAGTNLYGSQQAAAGSRRVGLGLVLERNDANRSIVIRDLVPDFAAHRSGKVQRGDILLAVDAEPTTGYDLDQIKYLTSGEDGYATLPELARGAGSCWLWAEQDACDRERVAVCRIARLIVTLPCFRLLFVSDTAHRSCSTFCATAHESRSRSSAAVLEEEEEAA
eukprot:2239421-Rhodomonas_salina.2